MTTNTDPVRALIGEMTEYLDQQVDPELDVIAKWRDRLESALASAPQPSFDRRFADMLIGILGDVQDELGFTDEEKLCANGSAEIVAAIRELKERAASQQPAAPSGEAVAWAAMSANGSRVVSISLERDEFVGHVVPLYTAPQQPAAVDEAGTWSKRQPACPGIYGIRGFNLCRPASEQFEAVVVVREYGGELVCNLHESTSEDDLESWAPICDLDPDFEWRAFVPGWEQRGGRALAAQQQGGAA